MEGLVYILPNGMHGRLMEPSELAPLRASFNNRDDKAINPFTGKPPQPHRGLPRAERLDYVRTNSHLELNP